VLATFGLMMFFNELASVIWGSRPYYAAVPQGLEGAVSLFGNDYPVYRLMIIGVGALVAVGAWCPDPAHALRHADPRRRQQRAHGQRAGRQCGPAEDAAVPAGRGAGRRGRGALAGPILSVQSGMGEPVLILALVVIVVGGIGSVRGTLVAALLIAMIDTLGRAFLPDMLRAVFDASVANAVGPALASMLIYVLMAVVLVLRPAGLFPAPGR
jgi:branched-chain amino acid transport system permease protein